MLILMNQFLSLEPAIIGLSLTKHQSPWVVEVEKEQGANSPRGTIWTSNRSKPGVNQKQGRNKKYKNKGQIFASCIIKVGMSSKNQGYSKEVSHDING